MGGSWGSYPYCPHFKKDCDDVYNELWSGNDDENVVCPSYQPVGGIKNDGPKYKPVDNCSLDGFLKVKE